MEAEGEPFHYNADGEIHGPVERRTWTIHPDGWRLVVPPTTRTVPPTT